MVKRICLFLLLTLAARAGATPTENQRLRVLPAPGPVTVDGKAGDWDLSGGIFVCGDAEAQRDSYAVWFHAMYDAKCLYLLARWKDETPLNNPGDVRADLGFQGDCLQVRIITAPGTPNERTSHLTCWQGKTGADIIDIEYGKQFNEGKLKDARTAGAQQAFLKDADGKGYAQEMALPWSLLIKGDQPPKPGDSLTMTLEPNFTTAAGGRLTIKDIFKPGTPDRVFTFMSSQCWGAATLEKQGRVAPQPVRLADAREFPARIQGAAESVDWNGLIKSKELPGFKSIAFTIPQDGYVSLNIKDAGGKVVRQLLTAAWMSKGRHEVKWDGLTTPNVDVPGQPVPAGRYTWSALWHTGIGLRLRGWACNAGSAPWDNGPGTNWGGDHASPSWCAAEGDTVVLAWYGAEAGQAVVACDLQGNVKWKNTRFPMTGTSLVALDGGIFYGIAHPNEIYRMDARTGAYAPWPGTDSPDLAIRSIWPDPAGKPDKPDGFDARAGRLYLTFNKENLVAIVDAKTAKVIRTVSVPGPSVVRAVSDTLVYVTSEWKSLLALNPTTGEVKPFVAGLQNPAGVAVGPDGTVYVAERDPDNQIKVFSPDGKPAVLPGAAPANRAIGRKGGRPLLGPWVADGMRFACGMALDAQGKLWLCEADNTPKRVSVWDAKSGKLVKELFGPTFYGATGGTINPLDPNLMVGQGCEWRIDPKTGRDTCVGVITRDGMGSSRFAVGANGRLYLAVGCGWAFDDAPLNIYERLGNANYKLRTQITVDKKANTTICWSDENDDQQRQPNEVVTVPGAMRFAGWYSHVNSNLTLYGMNKPVQVKVAGFTPCGAPKYDWAGIKEVPGSDPSPDDRLVLKGGAYGESHSWMTCYETATGKELWSYPDTFVGVHGSHNAVPPEAGLVRGSFGSVGSAQLPAPIGTLWGIATNVSEWHLITGDGFYLSRLFEPDSLKHKWPDQAVPGASMDSCPPGMGGEDFGGSLVLGKDGKVYVQAGKVAFWNLEVTGLNTVKAMRGGALALSAGDVKTAQGYRERALQAGVGTRRMAIKRLTPAFTGSLEKDFAGAEIAAYKKQEDAPVRVAAAWDDQALYLGYDVADNTPWVNGAGLPEEMYLKGDTVDFQLATDPKADPRRDKAVLGDLRLSIGSLAGQPTAVIYRLVAREKHPKMFSSGVIRSYLMESVVVAKDVKVTVNKRGSGYVVEAAVPLSALELKPAEGMTLRGDFGVTYGDPAGQRTRLRAYWNNQHTGIVDDAVFELMMEPKNWGELTLK